MYHFFIIPSDIVISFPFGSVYFFKEAVLKNSALDLYSLVLLINGANTKIRDEEGNTPFDLLAERSKYALI